MLKSWISNWQNNVHKGRQGNRQGLGSIIGVLGSSINLPSSVSFGIAENRFFLASDTSPYITSAISAEIADFCLWIRWLFISKHLPAVNKRANKWLRFAIHNRCYDDTQRTAKWPAETNYGLVPGYLSNVHFLSTLFSKYSDQSSKK